MTLGAAACVGDVPDGVDTNPNPNPKGDGSTEAQLAKKSYDDNVYSIVSSNCGGCHNAALATPTNPAFVGESKETGYNQIVGFSQLIGTWTNESAGVYSIPQIAAHAGVTPYTQEQKDAIAAWLSLEATARAGGNPNPNPNEETPGAASARLTKAFQECMALADFTAEQAPTRMANQQSGEGSCDKCHQSGQGAMIANAATNPDLLPMFPLLKSNAYFLSTFYTVNVGTKPYAITFNDAVFIRVATRKFPHQDHPNFSTTGNNAAGLNAMRAFMTKTLARLDANGNCPTPQQ
ncbi:MAG: hypothetical protein R3B48_01735 [Kofleriaceae bacterium]